jgi:hypothetical protein
MEGSISLSHSLMENRMIEAIFNQIANTMKVIIMGILLVLKYSDLFKLIIVWIKVVVGIMKNVNVISNDFLINKS